ncbi:Crp/Fnr family transcriptional regulator [Pelomonas sp. CA6]|uniref:Crp/Fnr family transcriptional regulator n=1 Tax=Pelomonas sp. CA6 TaxID=2907999 RepID=UPI001F4B22D3|nr:Crp/Fnr family transcriptional regulator [Pelomonas sp. CA6]MCH7341972.1 Crp/Fnr family transcriptional regulator [Pelomonas sp. CA6]
MPTRHASDLAWRVMPGQWQALLAGAPGTALQALDLLASRRRLQPGATVFRRGQAARGLLAVLDGQVGLGLVREDQGQTLERTLRGPQWLDLASAWLDEVHQQDAWCITEADVLELPMAPLRACLQERPELAEGLMRQLARQLRELGGITHELMHMDAEKRLAAWLLRRAAGLSSMALGERKRDIAAQLAIAPETLSRLMRQLKIKGLIDVQGYTVRLLAPDQLRLLAQG